MSKKTILRLGDETYVALLQPGNVYSRNTLYTGRLFRITNKKGEILGCLSTFIGNMIFSWSEILKSDPDLEERLFLRILPHIPFEA